MTLELFHATDDGGDSAAARKYIVDHDLVERIRFRNVTYDEVKTDFSARGGTQTPALWDGETLTSGRAAVLAKLAQIG